MWLIPCCTVQFQFFWYVFKTLPSFWKFFGRQDLVLRSGKQWSHHSCKQKNKNASEAKREGYNSDVLIRALCWYKFVFASAFVSAKMSYEWGYPCIQSGYLLIYRVLDTSLSHGGGCGYPQIWSKYVWICSALLFTPAYHNLVQTAYKCDFWIHWDLSCQLLAEGRVDIGVA